MTLESILQAKLAEVRAEAGGCRHLRLDAPGGGAVVELQVESADTVGCRLREVRVVRSEAAADLAAFARRFAGRITGLLEMLTVHEIDTTRGLALLRSDSPSAKGDARAYYELTVAPAELTLRRWEGHRHASGRTQVAFSLTHEALVKLLSDLTA